MTNDEGMTKSKSSPIWALVNIALVLLSAWTGYAEMSPTKLSHMNPDLAFCLTLLVMTPIFVIGTMAISRNDAFAWPSWGRSPLRWQSDPLQAIFISTCISLGLFVGTCLRLRNSGPVGFWLAASFGSLFVEFLIGQALAYVIYRERIVRAT
jgi:hypothetical protein